MKVFLTYLLIIDYNNKKRRVVLRFGMVVGFLFVGGGGV